jgi:hypothetical protein
VSELRLVLNPLDGNPLDGNPLDGPTSNGYVGMDDLPPLGRCEIEPEMYRIFAHAVLGWHRRLPKAGGDVCQCGKSWDACEYVNLADDLLWTAAPPRIPR